MNKRKVAILGEKQTIELKFPEAKRGDEYKVDIQIMLPDGTIQSYQYIYEFWERIVRAAK